MKEYSIHYVDSGKEDHYGWYSDLEFAKDVMRKMQKFHEDVYLLERDVSEWRRKSEEEE